MVDQKCKTNSSICSEVVEKKLEGPLPAPVLSVERSPVLSSKKDAKILKKNSSHALSAKASCGKETENTPELRSVETRNRSSFSSPTISSSGKTNTENQKVQVQKIKPRLKKDPESEAIKTNQVKDTPAPRRPPLPVPKKIKKISAPPQVLKEIPIQTSIHPSQPTARQTKTQSETPVLQSKIQKAPTSLRKRTLNQNSVSQFEPSKQHVRRSGTQKTSVPPQALARKTRIPASIGQFKSPTSTKKTSRIREPYSGVHEEPIHYIMWEDADEYYDDVEPLVFPSVAILPCGCSFHAECLDGITPEENSSDPPCFFCLSCTS